jgi:GNAT superfamily N-acetyltransferase
MVTDSQEPLTENQLGAKAETGAQSRSMLSTISGDVTVAFPDVSSADDPEFVSCIVDLVNVAYEYEQAIFTPGYKRTYAAEIEDYLRNQLLGVAMLETQEKATPIGCVYVERSTPTQGKFGMMALSHKYRGGGLGSRLVHFAEDACRREGRTVMRVEALVPTTYRHPVKERLDAWYQRLGYELLKIGRFDEDYPNQAAKLAGPTDYKVFTKRLA